MSTEHVAARAQRDALEAVSLAMNCLLYEDDPGPEQVNVGSEDEPAWVEWAESWRMTYTRLLLQHVDADPQRLTAATAICRRQLRHVDTLPGILHTVRARLQPTPLPRARPWRDALRAFSPADRRDARRIHTRALGLCERATRIVIDAGADQDPTARKRLAAAARHANLSFWIAPLHPAIEPQSRADLLADLDAIDADDHDTGSQTDFP